MASTKKPSPAQIAARKAFAERARSGGFKRRKKVATSGAGAKVKRRVTKPPSPAQLAARAKFVKMVRARAAAKKKTNSRGLSSRAPTWTRSKKAKRKNVEQGFIDATGFHPIRASTDYDDSVDYHGTERHSYKQKGWSHTRTRKSRAKKPVSKKRKNALFSKRSFAVLGTGGNKGGSKRGGKTRVGKVTARTIWGAKRKAKRLTRKHGYGFMGIRSILSNPQLNPLKFKTEKEFAAWQEGARRKGGNVYKQYLAAKKKRSVATRGTTKKRFKRPAKRALARAFSGSGLLGLGRSRKTVRARNPRLMSRGEFVKSYKSASRKGGRPVSGRTAKGYFKKLRKMRAKLPNPSPANVFSEFRGKDVRSKTRSTGHGSGHITVAQLGHLRELCLPGKKLEFGGKALLCADGRKRLHIGGVRFKASGAEEDMGEVRSVTYRSDKPHIETGTFDYAHRFGENGGRKPHLIIDAGGYPYFEGGSYKISEDGILD